MRKPKEHPKSKNHHDRRKKILLKITDHRKERTEEEVKRLLKHLDQIIEEELEELTKQGE